MTQTTATWQHALNTNNALKVVYTKAVHTLLYFSIYKLQDNLDFCITPTVTPFLLIEAMSSHGRKQSKLLIDKRRSGGGRKTIDETPDAKGGDPTFFQSLTLQKEQEQREQSEVSSNVYLRTIIVQLGHCLGSLQRRFRFNLAIKRQKLYQDRFRFIGNIYVRHLRKFSWAQSLQHAFEIPSSYSISLVKDNYFLPIKTFASALRYAAGYELTVAADKYFEEFIDCLWNTFDVAVVDLVDYREVLCFWRYGQMQIPGTFLGYHHVFFTFCFPEKQLLTC